jgi:dienelactone hydrolase
MKNLLTFALISLAAASLCQARIVTKPVAYEHGGVKLEGFLAYDDEKTAKGKLPGVLVVPEWWGLTDYPKQRAQQLAQLGYVAFALDMYGAGVTTLDPKKAGELAGQFYGKPLMAERARAGLDQLLQTGLVDEKKVAVIGYCFGGATAQVLAYSGMVSFHGSLVAASPEAAAKNRARFLICHGAVDPFIKAEERAAFEKSMNEGKFDYVFVSYAGAIHAFTNKDADRVAAQAGLQGVGYNEAADRRSWEHMKSFLQDVFAAK